MGLPEIPAQDLVFHILMSRMTMAARWERSPARRNTFMAPLSTRRRLRKRGRLVYGEGGTLPGVSAGVPDDALDVRDVADASAQTP